MPDRALPFVKNAGWGDATTTPIAGDLSARRYVRLTKQNNTAVLMDAGKDTSSTTAFVWMTNWLQITGISAPTILSAAPDQGLLLLEDLGTMSVGQMLLAGQETDTVFSTCLDLLWHIRQQPNPKLSCPGPRELTDWTKLADTYYPNAKASQMNDFRAVLETVLISISSEPPSVSLRDFHADNLMWLPDRTGIQRLGLLDYQDAFLTHPVYDLVSLLTDARMDVSRNVRETYIHAYATLTGDNPTDLHRAFAALSVQRNLRILGIFHKAAIEHGKRHHLPKVPRVYGYLMEALEHPVFDDIRGALQVALPPPRVAA
ncbi:phosphotransferase [Rhodobacteraceae bacterium]|nr:phosphotransferase [Paracoccaceae bacterium]